MGRYAGSMPGGAQRNPARKPYEGSSNDYNIGLEINRMMADLPSKAHAILQFEVIRLYRNKVPRAKVREFVALTIEQFWKNQREN
jgi:hypothetical protein